MHKISKVIVIIAVVGAIAWVVNIIRPSYEPAIWSEPFDAGWRAYQFCKYDLTTTYKMLAYRELNKQVPNDRKMFILFQNPKTEQYFIVFQSNEIEKIDFDKVTFTKKRIMPTVLMQYLFKFRGVRDFEMLYLLPTFINKDFSDKTPPVEIRDLEIESKNKIETANTDILYVEANFRKLGFYRVSADFFKKYTVPVFKFKNNMKGILALIKDKKTGNVIFSVGCNYAYNDFDKDEYLNTIKSLTFDAEPVPEVWDKKNRNEWAKAHIPKKELSEMSRTDIMFKTLFLNDIAETEKIANIAEEWEESEDKAYAFKSVAETYQRHKDYGKAFYYIDKAISILGKIKLAADTRRYSAFYTRLASLFLQKLNFDNADAALKKAKDLDPNDPYIIYFYGVMADLKGNVEEANKLYQKFLTYRMTTDYDRAFARKRLESFNKSNHR